MVLNSASIVSKMADGTGSHRSRFFFHFNTPGRKRTLVVQWVSVEVSTQDESNSQAFIFKPRHCRSWHENYGRLIQEYRACLMLSRV